MISCKLIIWQCNLNVELTLFLHFSFDVKYRDVFEIIRFNNLVNIDNDNFDNTTNIYLGLLYFKNVRILKDLETKIVKYIKTKYYQTFPSPSFKNLVYIPNYTSQDDENETISKWLKEHKISNVECLINLIKN